jgi:hypothetical protein
VRWHVDVLGLVHGSQVSPSQVITERSCGTSRQYIPDRWRPSSGARAPRPRQPGGDREYGMLESALLDRCPLGVDERPAPVPPNEQTNSRSLRRVLP